MPPQPSTPASRCTATMPQLRLELCWASRGRMVAALSPAALCWEPFCSVATMVQSKEPQLRYALYSRSVSLPIKQALCSSSWASIHAAPWAARYNTWLLIKLMLTGIVPPPFLFFFPIFLCFPFLSFPFLSFPFLSYTLPVSFELVAKESLACD